MESPWRDDYQDGEKFRSSRRNYNLSRSGVWMRMVEVMKTWENSFRRDFVWTIDFRYVLWICDESVVDFKRVAFEWSLFWWCSKAHNSDFITDLALKMYSLKRNHQRRLLYPCQLSATVIVGSLNFSSTAGAFQNSQLGCDWRTSDGEHFRKIAWYL